MLLGLLAAAVARAYYDPAPPATYMQPQSAGDPSDVGSKVHDAILMFRAQQLAMRGAYLVSSILGPLQSGRGFGVLSQLPFILFGLWLGAALWWVTRRLYNNAGGYIALALYCSSSAVVALSSHVNAEIIAAWGLFGIVYTAIGVAHTLYAPPKKWRPRIVLLGTAFGITAAAHVSTALVGLVLAALFMLYLAPGRRLASIIILAEAGIIAFFILWACYGFSQSFFAIDLASALQPKISLHQARLLLTPAYLPLLFLLAISLLTFFIWPHTRYFGNWAPLLVFTLLVAVSFGPDESLAWALPFAFVFIGGIFADLLETRWQRSVAFAAVLAIALQAGFAVGLFRAG